jgi:hypothetical protein
MKSLTSLSKKLEKEEVRKTNIKRMKFLDLKKNPRTFYRGGRGGNPEVRRSLELAKTENRGGESGIKNYWRCKT